MVVLLESYLQNLKKSSIGLALTFNIAPETFRQYVDDSYVQFGNRNNATEFLNVLNSQDRQVMYTTEYENDNKELKFFDIATRNDENYSCDFTIYCKPAITNVYIKLSSNISPHRVMRIFTTLLLHELKICWKKYLNKKIFNKRLCF